jgi:hypothetical protein
LFALLVKTHLGCVGQRTNLDMMHITHQQEEFSRAFIYAISAAAGLKFSNAAMPDDDSVDVAISARGPRGTIRSPHVEIQCKCQMSAAVGDPIPYPLSSKNYEDLRHGDYQVPRILVVVFVPQQVQDWTSHTEQEFTMRYCAYWASLRGLPPSSNEFSTTVYLPRAHLFNVAGLETLMNRIGRGETL